MHHFIIIRDYGVSKLRTEFLFSLGLTALLGVLLAASAFPQLRGGAGFWVAYVIPFLAAGIIGWTRIEPDHARPRLGPANWISIARLAAASLLCGLAADVAITGSTLTHATAWATAALAAAGIMLDGVDGWIARRGRYESAFGARLDMEVDAFLILVLSVIAWQLGKAGPWVILLGAMRYLFWIAGLVFARFAAPLPESFRRKAACVMTGVVLTALMAPVFTAPLSAWFAAAALTFLGFSFLVDSVWLIRRRQTTAPHRR